MLYIIICLKAMNVDESMPFDFLKSQKQEISLYKIKPWIYKPQAKFTTSSKITKKYASAKWTDLENQRYTQFLIKFKNIVEQGGRNARRWNLYRMMSKSIGSRSH